MPKVETCILQFTPKIITWKEWCFNSDTSEIKEGNKEMARTAEEWSWHSDNFFVHQQTIQVVI